MEETKPLTEIQFLLDIILETKTISEVRRKCKERIGVVESNPGRQFRNPSTVIPMNTAPAPMPIQRIVGGEVEVAPGIKGPRKF